jgi:hypothetical protein
MVEFEVWAAQHGYGGEQDHDAKQAEPDREAVRLAGRRSALAWALAWSVPFAPLLLLGTYMAASIARSRYVGTSVPVYSANPAPPPPYLLWLLVPTVLGWLVCTGAEVVLARTLAGDYLALRPWVWAGASRLLQVVRGGAGRIDRRLSNGGGGCLAIVALMLAGPLLVLGYAAITTLAVPLWVLLVLTGTAAELVTAAIRLRGWKRRRMAEPTAGDISA